MRAFAFRFVLFLVGISIPSFLTVAPCSAADESSITRLGQKIDNLTFQETTGKTFSLHDLKDKKAIVVVFLSFDCPVSTSYTPVLTELAKQYEPQGVAFVGVCPGDDKPANIARRAREYQVPFPMVKDHELRAVSAFQAGHTPEAFVLDGGFQLRYRGRIDNGYAARLKKKAQTTRHDLRQALDELLAGKPVSEPVTQAIGCAIARTSAARPASGTVTFNRDILPILQKNCQECHRPDEVAPFPLLTYKHAVQWADDIKEYTRTRKMPPWKPVDSHGLFLNERVMSARDIDLIARWVDGGTPEGNPADRPPPRQFPEGWQLGEPDLVLEMPEDVIIGPTGRDLFRNIVYPTNFQEDKYLSAMEVRPGNKRVVHHTLNLFDTTGQGRKLQEVERHRARLPGEQDHGPGYTSIMGTGFIPIPPKVMLVSGWAPGMLYRHLPDGIGYHVPRGADILVQVHYHRTGKVERDRTRVGLYFAKKPVSRSNLVLAVPGVFLTIPAGRENYKVQGRIWFDQDLTIYSIMPHMHLLGRDIQFNLTLPDGTTKPLVHITDWDFNWQEFYYLKEPLRIPAGSRFDVVAYYDNSANNPANPHQPPRTVIPGEQTTDEMCLVFFSLTADKPGVFPIPWPFPPKIMTKTAGKKN